MQKQDLKIEIYETPDNDRWSRWRWVVLELYVEVNQGAHWVNVGCGNKPEYFDAAIAAYKRYQELVKKYEGT